MSDDPDFVYLKNVRMILITIFFSAFSVQRRTCFFEPPDDPDFVYLKNVRMIPEYVFSDFSHMTLDQSLRAQLFTNLRIISASIYWVFSGIY